MRFKSILNSKNLLRISFTACQMHIFTKNIFLTQISKRSTPTYLHHPDLHWAQFFSLESLKTSSAYAKTSSGPKMENFLQTINVKFKFTKTVFFHDFKNAIFWLRISILKRIARIVADLYYICAWKVLWMILIWFQKLGYWYL